MKIFQEVPQEQPRSENVILTSRVTPFPYHKLEFHFMFFKFFPELNTGMSFHVFLTTFLVKIKRKCLIQPELKYFKMRIHPPPPKKKSTAPGPRLPVLKFLDPPLSEIYPPLSTVNYKAGVFSV